MNPEHKRYILENKNKKSIKELSRDLGIKERKIRKLLEKNRGAGNEKPAAKTVIDRRVILISAVLIIILGFSVYANSVKGEFIRDDESLIRDNIYIKSWSKISNCFTNDIAAGGRQKWNSYRPFQMLTYMIDHSLWKLDVRGYHLTNIMLHILTALVIYWFLNLIYGDGLLALFTSALFVINPLHVEAVSYISGRADSLSAVFFLLCFIFYIKLAGRKNIILYILMALSYISAILSRENALILPILLLLYHYTFKKKIPYYAFFSIFGITMVYILIRQTILSDFLSNITYPTTLFERMPGFFVAIVNYIRLLILPFNLHTEYGLTLFKFYDPKAILGIIIVAVLSIYAFRKRDIDKILFFSIGWFFITLLPHSNLYPVNAYMREHWLYLPSVGFFLVLADVLKNAYHNRKTRMLAVGALLFLSVFYACLTIRQNDYWRNPISFYQRTLRYAPDDYKEYINMGNAYRHVKNYEKAIASYKKAIEIDPSVKEAYNNLGVSYKETGDNQNATVYFKKAIEIDPRYETAFNSLGLAYYDSGKTEEAIAAYKKAAELDPGYSSPYYNLGIVYKAIGKIEDAIAAYKKAIEIDPNYLEALNNLAGVYISTGNNKEAIALYQKVLNIAPDFNSGYNNLAVAYYYDKQYDLAIKYCDRAIALGCKIKLEFLKLLEPHRKK